MNHRPIKQACAAARVFAMLAVLTALLGCSGSDASGSLATEHDVRFAWVEGGETFVLGMTLDAWIEASRDKALHTQNGWGYGNNGYMGSCGNLANDTGCTFLADDKDVWIYPNTYTNTAPGNAMLGAEWLVADAQSKGTGFHYTETGSSSSANLKFTSDTAQDFEMSCEVLTTRSAVVSGSTKFFKVCDRWRIEIYEDQFPGESSSARARRQRRGGAWAAAIGMGLIPTLCGSVLATNPASTTALGNSDKICSQQDTILTYFAPWYSSGGYAHNGNAPSGL